MSGRTVIDKGLTLPEIAKRAGLEYRTLKSWVDRGLLGPVVREGAGVPLHFTRRQADVARALGRWRSRGLGMNALTLLAAALHEFDHVVCPICHGLTGLEDTPGAALSPFEGSERVSTAIPPAHLLEAEKERVEELERALEKAAEVLEEPLVHTRADARAILDAALHREDG